MKAIYIIKKLGLLIYSKSYNLFLYRFDSSNHIFDFQKLIFWNKFFVFIVSIVVCLCIISLFGANILERLVNPLKFASSNMVILELYPESNQEKTQSKIKIVVDYLGKQDFIIAFEVVSKEKIQKMLNDFTSDFKEKNNDIDLPTIISIKTQTDSQEQIENLRLNLSQKVKGVYLDTEQDLLNRLANPISTAKYLAIFTPLIAIVVFISILFLIVYAILFSNKETIETLFYMGMDCRDLFIEFSQWIFIKTLQATLLGVVFGIISIMIFISILQFDILILPLVNYFVFVMSSIIFLPICSSLLGAFFVSRIIKKSFKSI
jgi:cell division protein FtsX